MARPGNRSLLRSLWAPEQSDATPWQTPVVHSAAVPALSANDAAQPERKQATEVRATSLLASTAKSIDSNTTKPAVIRQPSFDSAEICAELPSEKTLGLDASSQQVSATPLLDPSFTFRLHSDPTASKVIYLDFDGHTTTGTSWNTSTMGSSFYSPAYDIDGNPSVFSATELSNIQQIWQRVASDYAPFDVDVTTQAPPDDWLYKSSSTDANYGIRAVVTSYGPSSSGAGGIAFVSSFNSGQDIPAFVYNATIVGAAEALSHEVGHTLGLSHDGTSLYEYYTGHGSGETGWAPIMGASYNRSVTTWDDGTYTDSNNKGSTANYGKGADDLAVITGYNGFGYQSDLIGNSMATAAPLIVNAGNAAQYGTIETRLDSDWFSFQLLASGDLSLTFDPYWYAAQVDTDGVWGGNTTEIVAPASDTNTATPYPDHTANLDLAVELYNNQGALLGRSNDPGLATRLAIQGLSASTYYLKLDGVGFGDPTTSPPTGYTDFGGIGNYWISGTITNAVDSAGSGSTSSPTPKLSAANLSQAEGTGSSSTTFVLQVLLDAPSSSDISVDYRTVDDTAVSSGSGTDYAATSGTLHIAPGLTSGSIAINVVADGTAEADESFLVNLSNVSGATLTTSQARVTILNDDIISGGNGQKRKAKAMLSTEVALDQQTLLMTSTSQKRDSLTGLACNRENRTASNSPTPQQPGLGQNTTLVSGGRSNHAELFSRTSLTPIASINQEQTSPLSEALGPYGLGNVVKPMTFSNPPTSW